jgi:hypothetical protein
MAYVFDLERDFDQEPYVDAGGARVIDFALGYELDRSLVIVMSVMLVPDESGAFELCFGIRTRSATDPTDVSPPDYDSVTARQFVPREATTEVLGAILSAVVVLVKSARPHDIIMETFHANLPPWAMKKYEMISIALEGLSYQLRDQFRDEIDGKDYWAFNRKD